jgi:hypothetical protein
MRSYLSRSTIDGLHVKPPAEVAVVRRGDELHDTGGVLDDVRAGLAEEGEELLVPRRDP